MITADKGARLGNVLIDSVLFLILGAAVGTILEFASFFSDDVYVIIFSAYPLVLYFGYYFLFEFLLNKTPGKYLTKTIVVDRHGKKPSAGKVIIRTMLRFIPYDSFSFIFSFVGLHDSLSKTIVVKDTILKDAS